MPMDAETKSPEPERAPLERGQIVLVRSGLPGSGSRNVEKALRAADAGEAYHWPTIAAILAAEVRRLRELTR